MPTIRCAKLSTLLLMSSLAAVPAELPPKRYLCVRANSPVVVDGKLDDRAWRRAAWTDWFLDIRGVWMPRPRFRTRAKMLWDDTYFYVAAELEEPDVWATLTQHDSVIFRDNDFEVFLNPTGDGRNYFEFEINALNTGWDLFLAKPYRQRGHADNSWEIPGFRSAVSVQGTLNHGGDRDRSWTVELAFPWSAFTERSGARRPEPGSEWRLNFSRVEWQVRTVNGHYEKLPNQSEDNWVWSPQGIVDMHLPERWGFVRFIGR
ncbi:MAG TPA: carbohydrate-binding family 9-like protein [Bryobacteraceae bacterium]|nr:carbohydrate-binding family 9-like protein [Bryobacteraceae bacterium]